MKVGRVTLSDRASAGIYEDRSGPEIDRILSAAWGEGEIEIVRVLLADEREALSEVLRRLCDEEHCAWVVTTGGTGPSPRDITPEATRDVIEKELPGFGEIQRIISFAKVPTSILSRATAGVRGETLIVNLPGNPAAIEDCLPPLIPAVKEAIRHIRKI